MDENEIKEKQDKINKSAENIKNIGCLIICLILLAFFLIYFFILSGANF